MAVVGGAGARTATSVTYEWDGEGRSAEQSRGAPARGYRDYRGVLALALEDTRRIGDYSVRAWRLQH